MRNKIPLFISILLAGCSSPKYYQFHSGNPYVYSHQQQKSLSGPIDHDDSLMLSPSGVSSNQPIHVNISVPMVSISATKEFLQNENYLPAKTQVDTVKNKVANADDLKSTNAKVSLFSAIGAYVMVAVLSAAQLSNPVFIILYASACIAAIVFGATALKRHEKKRWMALTGMIMGTVGLVVPLVAAILFLLFLDAFFKNI